MFILNQNFSKGEARASLARQLHSTRAEVFSKTE